MSNQKGFCLWFTGLSGSGKSPLSRMLEPELRKRGCKVEILDGDGGVMFAGSVLAIEFALQMFHLRYQLVTIFLVVLLMP